MTNWCKASVTALVTASCGALLLSQSTSSPSCTEIKKRFATLVAAEKTDTPVSQFRAYLKFLTSISDDPEDCVTSDVRAAISSVEKDLIQLRIGDHTYSPDKVLHCNEIDDRTQTCKGAELDDTPLDDETALLAPKRALPKTGTATISVAEGADFKVLALFAQGRAALQDGKPPVQIPMRDGAFSLNELQRYPHPALILTLHGNDTLRFRKCVWLF